MRDLLLLSSNILVFICYLLYIKAILKGNAKPHRTTRLVLLVITGIASFSLLAQSNQTAIWLIGLSATFSLVVFMLSLKYGMGGWSRLDVACFIVAIAGIVFWQLSDNPVIALYLSIFADFIGIVPTLIKTYKFPNTEVWYFNSLGGLSAFLNMLAIKNWTYAEIAYPLYLTLINLIIVLLIIRPRMSNTRAK